MNEARSAPTGMVENELALRVLGTVAHAAQQALLPRRQDGAPNLHVIYLHPALATVWKRWRIHVNFRTEAAAALEDEFGPKGSSSALDGAQHRVVLWPPVRDVECPGWTPRPDHFGLAGRTREILAFSTHADEAQWEAMAPDVNTSEPEDHSAAILEAWFGGGPAGIDRRAQTIVDHWSPLAFATPLQLELHLLAAASLEVLNAGAPGRPPFDRADSVLAFIESMNAFHVPLLPFARRYATPSARGGFDHALEALEAAHQRVPEATAAPSSPLNCWLEGLRLLRDLPDFVAGGAAGADKVLELLLTMETRFAGWGSERSGAIRLAPLVFARLWALAEAGGEGSAVRTRRFLRRVRDETEVLYGGIFSSGAEFDAAWTEFSGLAGGNLDLDSLLAPAKKGREDVRRAMVHRHALPR